MARAHAQFPQEPTEAQPSATTQGLSAPALRSWLRTMVPGVTAAHAETDAAPADIPTADRPVFALPPASDLVDQDAAFSAAVDDDLEELCSRLDTLTRRLSRLATRIDSGESAAAVVAEATADDPVDAAITEIFARQCVLAKAEPAGPTMFPPTVDVPADDPTPEPSAMAAAAGACDLSGLEQQLKLITKQLEILRQPCRAEELVAELRQELSGIAATLDLLVPRSAFEALEHEVFALGDRLDSTRDTSADTASLATIEQGLAELRDAISNLAPVELGEAVLTLTHKVDQVTAGVDPLTLQQLDAATSALRSIVTQVASGDALAALVHEVRELSEKIDRNQANGAEPLPAALDHDLLLALEREVSGIAATLNAKADQVPVPAIEPLIETIIRKLDRFDLFADNETMFAPITAHISELGDKIDRLQPTQADPAAFAPLEAKLGHIADTIERMNAPGIEQPLVTALSERMQAIASKLDRIEENTPLRIDTGPLEDRIAELAEKLGASEARLGNLEGIKQGMAELMTRLDEIRTAAGVDGKSAVLRDDLADAGEAAAGPADETSAFADDPEALAPPPAAVTADHPEFIAEPAANEPEAVPDLPGDDDWDGWRASENPHAPADDAAGSTSAGLWLGASPQIDPVRAPDAAERDAAIDDTAEPEAIRLGPAQALSNTPTVPADTPIEPGLAPPRFRIRPTTAERIAASQAALGPLPAERTTAKAGPNFIIAARRAAQAASEQHGQLAAAAAGVAADIASGAAGQGLTKRMRSLFVGGSAILLVLGATGIMLSIADRQNAANDQAMKLAAAPTSSVVQEQPAAAAVPATTTSVATMAPAVPTESEVPIMAPAVQEANPGAGQAAPVAPATAEREHHTQRLPQVALADITGSLGTSPASEPQTVPSAEPVKTSAPNPWSEPALPSALKTKPLLAGIETHNPGAAYEIALRYAEGRGVEADMAAAAIWLARAADGGVVPAQFRLGSFYEKGIGVKKDLARARRYYSAAANQGYAHAMHNLAVLYAEGGDGQADYSAAVKWFRKAAEYGVADSQYNAAVLLARGIGVEKNLGEAYKWFAVAAKGGDEDAAKKRDAIGKRLDPQTLAAARLAASVFAPTPQPQEATAVHAPATGWNDITVLPPKPRARTRHGARSARL